MKEYDGKVDLLFGFVELVPVQEVRRDGIYGGGYAITRDYRGNEISRTQTQWYSKLTWDAPTSATPPAPAKPPA
jgi:hypothetical protein